MDYQKKLKFVTKEDFEKFSNMEEEELVTVLKEKHAFMETKMAEKKSSEILKEIRSEIAEYRKNWAKKYPEKQEEILEATEHLKQLKESRDLKIHEGLEEKKDLEGGYNDHINACKEYVDVLVFCLRFHQ